MANMTEPFPLESPGKIRSNRFLNPQLMIYPFDSDGILRVLLFPFSYTFGNLFFYAASSKYYDKMFYGKRKDDGCLGESPVGLEPTAYGLKRPCYSEEDTTLVYPKKEN